jgi:hypothetical protein
MNTEFVTLEEVHDALSFCMRQYDKATLKLPRDASQIIDVYGLMVYEKRETMAWEQLTNQQQELIRAALISRQQPVLI